MTASWDDIDRLQAILDAIEEMLLRLPIEELPDADLRESDVQLGRGIIKAALQADGRRRMEKARNAMQAAKASPGSIEALLPKDAEARRSLLQRIIVNDNGRLPERLTVAFRDGQALTDAEVETILTSLAKLGILGDGGPK